MTRRNTYRRYRTSRGAERYAHKLAAADATKIYSVDYAPDQSFMYAIKATWYELGTDETPSRFRLAWCA
jgi:hypothetical protein